MAAISSIAAWKAASLALDGLLKPVIFLTNWSDAACTSSAVTGGSKLKSVLMFLHIFQIPHGLFCSPIGPTHAFPALYVFRFAGADYRFRISHPQRPGPRLSRLPNGTF